MNGTKEMPHIKDQVPQKRFPKTSGFSGGVGHAKVGDARQEDFQLIAQPYAPWIAIVFKPAMPKWHGRSETTQHTPAPQKAATTNRLESAAHYSEPPHHDNGRFLRRVRHHCDRRIGALLIRH